MFPVMARLSCLLESLDPTRAGGFHVHVRRRDSGPKGSTLFRLVVDKGKPDNLVSFCMDGVRKISPTQFEVRKTNFEPRRDLPVLIVEFYTTD